MYDDTLSQMIKCLIAGGKGQKAEMALVLFYTAPPCQSIPSAV